MELSLVQLHCQTHCCMSSAGLLGTFKGRGYYVTSSGSEPKAVEEPAVPTVQALLKGQGLPDQLPTVALVAHYDTFGVSTVSAPPTPPLDVLLVGCLPLLCECWHTDVVSTLRLCPCAGAQHRSRLQRQWGGGSPRAGSALLQVSTTLMCSPLHLVISPPPMQIVFQCVYSSTVQHAILGHRRRQTELLWEQGVVGGEYR